MTNEDDPINNRDNFKAGIFYYNPDDDRLIVRVPGTVNRYVFNYARWPVYLIVIPVAAMTCYALFFYKR
jgi:uncharacterized membrane protein